MPVRYTIPPHQCQHCGGQVPEQQMQQVQHVPQVPKPVQVPVPLPVAGAGAGVNSAPAATLGSAKHVQTLGRYRNKSSEEGNAPPKKHISFTGTLPGKFS